MLKSQFQLVGSKAVLATVLLGLISSSQAVFQDLSGRARIDLTVQMEQGREWSNMETGRGVRVELGAFPLDSRLLAGEVVIPPGVLVTRITERYRPEERSHQCVVLEADQALEDLAQAKTLPFATNRIDSVLGGLRIFCIDFLDNMEDS